MEISNVHDLPKLSKNDILDHHEESGLAAEFLRSAAYAGAEAPIRALAQTADHMAHQLTGGQADAAVKAGFKTIGVEPVAPAEFGTSRWMVQQVGGAVGMMAPFLAVRSGVKYGAGQLLGEQALSGSLEAGTASLGKIALREAAISGASGFVYGSLLSPSNEANVGNSSFFKDRAKSGLTDMASFAALSAVGPYVGKGIDAAAGAVESSTFLPSAARAPLGAALRFPLVTGVISGVPSGVVAAEVNALKDGRLLASGQEFKESIGSMSVVGGAMNTASWLLERASRPDQSVKEQAKEQAKTDGKDRPDESKGITAHQLKDEAALKELIDQTIKRMSEEKLKRSRNKGDSGIPDDDILDMMDRSAGKRHGLMARNLPDEKAAVTQADIAKPGDANLATSPTLPGLDVVLGASGAETTAHVGFLKALEDNHVPIGRITGVSGGSLVATLYANKFSPDQIKDILLSDEFRHPSPNQLARMYHVADPWNLFPYSMDFKPWLQDFVDKYNLKPQQNLRIVAADAETHAPIIFEGTNYDLTTALTASTDATPALNLKPIQINGRTAVDGFYYHPTPTALCNAPSIASKIGFTHEMPHELLAPWDYFQHFKEVAYYDELKGRYPDPPGHIIAETGLPDVAMGTFSISKQTVEKLIEHGYYTTMDRLKQPDAVKVIQDAQKAAQNK